MEILDIYSDGGFVSGYPTWSYIVIKNNSVLFQDYGRLDKKYSSHRQIAGELKGVAEGLRFCEKNHYKANFYVDYLGCRNWVIDLIIPRETAWKRNIELAKKYRNFIEKHLLWINSINWIKGHNEHRWNELADSLASNEANYRDLADKIEIPEEEKKTRLEVEKIKNELTVSATPSILHPKKEYNDKQPKPTKEEIRALKKQKWRERAQRRKFKRKLKRQNETRYKEELDNLVKIAPVTYDQIRALKEKWHQR